MIVNLNNKPPLQGESWDVPWLELRASDNENHYYFFKQLVRDGVELNGLLENRDNIPSFDITIEGSNTHHYIWLTPKIFQFLLRYLLTGDNSRIPPHPKNGEVPDDRAEEDYIYRHVKREIQRNEYTYTEETQNEVNGIRFIGEYPYGSIDYGFFPYSWEELNNQLENVEPFVYDYDVYDLPDLHNTALSTEYEKLEKGKHLDSVFKEIPTNIILDKTICGCGATWLEINNLTRNSIIIEPNVPVIIGKEQQHKHLIGVYGETIKAKDIAEKIQNQTGKVKLMTTPDSYPKVVKALKSLNIDYLNDYFLLFDECEKIVSDIDYRPNLNLPIDDFFKFKGKAMVSATPIVINDPRFEQHGFKIIKIKPQFDYKQPLEFKPTNNVAAMLKRTVEKIDANSTICIFYNSVKGIVELVDLFEIAEHTNIYCSTEAKKDLKRSKYNVFDSVTDKNGNITLKKYNFFTSRFYSALDIELDYKPIVIMVTDVYKTVKDKTPYSLIDPETEAIQIVGRFRKGVERLIHITNTNSQIKYHSRKEVEEFLDGQHRGFLKLVALYDSIEAIDGEKVIVYDAIKRTDYYAEGFVNDNKEKNYFRYNNFCLEERLKMLYMYPTRLHKAYKRTGAFTVFSESEYAIYTDEERRKLKNKNSSKAERISLLNDILKRTVNSNDYYDRQLMDELNKEYPLYIEAFATIGYAKVKEMEFKDSDIRTAVDDYKLKEQLADKKVIKAVYNVFTENTFYPTKDIKEQLSEIFQQHNIVLHRQPQGKDIMLFFNAKETRTGQERGWELGTKLYKDV